MDRFIQSLGIKTLALGKRFPLRALATEFHLCCTKWFAFLEKFHVCSELQWKHEYIALLPSFSDFMKLNPLGVESKSNEIKAPTAPMMETLD